MRSALGQRVGEEITGRRRDAIAQTGGGDVLRRAIGSTGGRSNETQRRCGCFFATSMQSKSGRAADVAERLES